MKKIFSVFCVLFIFPFSAHAAVSISEIMYAPSGTDSKHEWIEIFNTGETAIDMSGYFFQTDGSAGAFHTLTPVGPSSLAAGSFGVIVQDPIGFRSDYPEYAGALFDSSWSDFTNATGKTLVLTTAEKNPVDTVTYNPSIGAVDDGMSLQKNSSGTWIAAMPTPGSATRANSSQSSGGIDTTDSTATDGAIQGTEGKDGTVSAVQGVQTGLATPSTKPVPIKVSIATVKQGTVESPIRLTPTVWGRSGTLVSDGFMRITFGDGTSAESAATTVFEHTYQYPGTYVVLARYFEPHSSSDTATVSVRWTVDITPATLSMSVDPVGSVTIENTGVREVDLSRWSIGEHSSVPSRGGFIFPQDTIILPKARITLPRIISTTRTDAVELRFPSGGVASMLEKPLVSEVLGFSESAPEADYLAPSVATLSRVRIVAMEKTPALAKEATLIGKNTGETYQVSPWVLVVGLGIFLVSVLLVLQLLLPIPGDLETLQEESGTIASDDARTETQKNTYKMDTSVLLLAEGDRDQSSDRERISDCGCGVYRRSSREERG